MSDLILTKTDDISKVPFKLNQLIFVDDGSMYFDFGPTKADRLHNSGGAKLENFIAGKEYLKNDMCVHQGLMYRALHNFTDYTWVASHWQMLSTSSGEGGGPTDSSNVYYDGSESGISATTVQEAIDALSSEFNKNDAECDEQIALLQQNVSNINARTSQLDQDVDNIEVNIQNLQDTIKEIQDSEANEIIVAELGTF